MARAPRTSAALLLLATVLAAAAAQNLSDGDDTPSSPASSTPSPAPGTASSTPSPAPGTASSTPSPAPGTASSTPAPAPGTASSTPSPAPGTASSTPAPAPGTASPAAASTPAGPTTSNTASTDAPTVTATLNIFFVNDLRYHLFPTASQTSPDVCASSDIATCYGGLVGLSDLRSENAKQSDVWLHSGAALGQAADAEAEVEDYYRLLKHQTAVDGLNLLNFGAMSVDADMYRFGKGREVTSKLNAKNVLTCANCNSDMVGSNVAAYVRVATGSSCDVVVIGVVNKDKMLGYLPTVEVTDEVQAVQDAITKAKASIPTALYVVVGEMSAATVEHILALADVGVVLSSGTIAEGTSVASNTAATKVSSTVSAEAAKAMNVGQLTLTLDAKCMPTNVKGASSVSYRNRLNDKASSTAATVVKGALDYASKAKIDGKAGVALSGNLDPCGYISCAIGQMAADGVHALVNTPDQETPIAVVIPAKFFSGMLSTAFNWTTLLAVVPDDPFFCVKDIAADQLYGLLDDMLGTQATFPQVSGLLLDQRPAEDGKRMVYLWTRSPGLAMRILPRDPAVNVTVAMPCLAMQSTSRFGKVEDGDVTSVALSDGLKLSLRITTPATGTPTATLTLPPQVEVRVRLYIEDSSRLACEDWVGMTVTYTLLVLGAIVMVAYQGYQLWRFRATLSYIR